MCRGTDQVRCALSLSRQDAGAPRIFLGMGVWVWGWRSTCGAGLCLENLKNRTVSDSLDEGFSE